MPPPPVATSTAPEPGLPAPPPSASLTIQPTGPITLLAGRYRLEQRLGRGGWSEVWRGFDEVLDRGVAIKLSTQGCPEEPAAAFAREARTLAQLDHPNIVAVYDIGVDQGRWFEVLELLPGPSLSAILAAQGPQPVEQSLRMAADAAFGLAAAHAVGVVHGDVKPANLVLGHTSAVHLVDFGIAQVGPADHGEPADRVMGTPEFLSPEAATGGPIGPRSDLYGLGCLLFALLTDTPPFSGIEAGDTLRLHLEAPIPDVRQRRPGVPAAVAGLIAELLAKDPAQRPASAAQVGHRLEALADTVADSALAGFSAPGGRLVARAVVSQSMPVPPAPSVSPAGSVPPRRRQRRIARLMVPLVILAGAVLGAVLVSWNHPVGSPQAGRAVTSAHHSAAHNTVPPTSQTTTPPPPSAAATTPGGSPQQAIAEARTAVDRALTQGALDDVTANDLITLLQRIGARVAAGEYQAAANLANELLGDLSDIAFSNDIGSSAVSHIEAPLNALAALLPEPR